MLKVFNGICFLILGYVSFIGAYLPVVQASDIASAKGQIVNGVWQPAVKAAVAKKPAVKPAIAKKPVVKPAVAKKSVVKAAIPKKPTITPVIVKKQIVKTPVPKRTVVKASAYTLQNVVTDVSKNNSNALYEYMQYEIASHSAEFEKGIFEPEFYASVIKKGVNLPNTVEQLVARGFKQSYTENGHSYELGVKGLLPTGGQWDLGFVESGRTSSLITQYRTYNTEYQAAVKAKLRQPILRGFGSDASEAKIKISASDKLIAKSRYEQRMMEVVGMTIRTYWELFGALEIRDSWQQSLNNSQKMYDDLKKKSKYGKVAQTDLIEAETGIAGRRGELLSASSRVIESQNKVLTLLNISSTLAARKKLDHLEAAEIKKISVPSFDQSYKRALKHWPNLKIAQERVKRQAVQVASARNMDRPQLDFVGDYNTASLDTSMSKAQTAAFRSKFSNWSVGLELKIPLLGDKRGSETLAIAEVGAQQAELELNALRMSVSNNLMSKLDQLESSQEQLIQYQNGLTLKKKLLNIEKSKFNAGQSDVQSVLALEEGYIKYQRKFLDSLVSWKLAEVSLNVADGTLLNRYAVRLIRDDR